MSAKRKRSPDSDSHNKTANTVPEHTIYRSEEIVDRQSRFIGLYSPTLTPKELQSLPEISTADHKILGWRRESNQQSLTAAKKYVTGGDDDGEKYGAKKVEQCLINANVTGACVVARWWGGIMLGPARFTYMETTAREAIQKWRDSAAEDAAKKRRVEDDKIEKERLLKVLVARDQSIVVLRNLASDKEAKLKSEDGSSTAASQSPAVQAPDYASMTVDRLLALEKARDATLGFLLKRIDKAEAALKAKTTTTNDEAAADVGAGE